MDNNKEEPVFASDIVFKSVYKISEDMLRTVHKFIATQAKYDMAFHQIASSLQAISDNLKRYIVDSKSFGKRSKGKVDKKIVQINRLISLCLSYSAKCRKIANEVVGLTEDLEKENNMKEVINNLIQSLEDETKRIQESDDDSEDFSSDMDDK